VSKAVEAQRISLLRALICMVSSLAVAIVLNETIARGHGKAIFFGVFVTSFITMTFRRSLIQVRIIAFLIGVAIFHIVLVFVLPADKGYPGGFLFPLGMVDIAIFYYISGFFTKR